MAEDSKISDDELLAAFKGEQKTPSQPVYSKEEAKGVSDEDMLSAFKGNAPGVQTSGGTLSGGGEMFRSEMVGQATHPEQSSLVGSGALGSGQFAPIPVGPKGKFEEYAGITDPDTRKGLVETVFKNITDPHDLEELHDKVQWYNIAENPVQMESLFQYKWDKKTDPFQLAADAAKAGVGMLESLPPLVAGAGRLGKDALAAAVYTGSPEAFGKGRTLTDIEKRGMSEQEIRDAELSSRDKTYRSARVFGDAALEAEEQLRKAVTSFAEGKSMLYDKARVSFANAEDYADFSGLQATPESIQDAQTRKAAKTAELMADARKNFSTRLNAKHVEHLQKEKNPAVLARELSAVWQYPAVKSFATDVIENLMPPAEDAAPGFGGDIEAARVARRAQAAEAAEVGVQSAIAESHRLREDPEQVGAVAMTTPVNIVGAGGMILGGLGKANQALARGLKALGKTDQEINAMFSAERAAVQAQREAAAIAREQPGRLESALGSMADTADKIPGALAKIPQPLQYAGATLFGAGAGALASDDPLAGALKGATTGAGIKLGGKAILAAPRLGQELLKAGRLSGAELGRFEAMEKMGSASPAVQKFVNWSQKAGGGKALDFIEKNANVFVQHNVSMMPMMMALGILEDKDAKEFSQMWAEFATYGFLHGQVLGGMLGNDPVRMKMNKDSEMRQAQRVMQASSPETRDNLRNLNWDRVIEHSDARLERTKAEYAKQLESDPYSPEAEKAKSDYDFAHQIHRQNLIAPPEARAAFEDGIKLSLAKASNLINGVLTPNSNMNIELLTSAQIYKKMIDANPNFNGVGAPLTIEQATAMNPGADGVKIGKGISKDGFTMDAAKDTVFVNLDNAMNKSRLSGEAIPNVIAHEVVGHGLFGKEDYRQKIAPLYNQMFGTEVMDENGNWREVTSAQPGLSREDLFEKFFTKYLEGKTPESVAQYAEAAGVWDKASNTFDKNKVVDLMREEVLAEAHAGRFFSDPESPAQRGIGWLASRISGGNVKSALNHLYSVAGPAVYKQWTSGATGATYSPEVMRAIRNVEREMQKYDGEFVDAEQGEAVAAPITKKDVIKSREMLQKYYGDTGKFETTPVAVVTDKNGKVVQTIDLKDKEAFEGSWNYHQDEATGDNVPNKEKGFGELPPELAGVEVPVGGRVQVQRQIAYDEATGKPLERKNKETVEAIKRRVQMLREAIDNAGDPSQLGRFRAIKGGQGKEDEDLHYTGKMTPEQRAAIAALPESVVPASMKELLFKYDDLMTRGDGTVLDIDYASRLNDKGNYQAFSPKIRQIVPLQLHLSKAGNFYTTAWDISDLRRKVKLYEKYAKGVFEPWGGDTQKFWNEFRTVLLPNLANPDANVPGWQGLDVDPNVAKLKRTIYEKMLGAPNPNVPDVESIPTLPREKFSRSEKKLDKQSSFDQIIKSFRLDSHTAAEENANSEYKYPIPYKARFMPEQEQAEEQRPAFGGGILKGLQAVSAKYDPKGTGEVKATVQPAEAQVRFMSELEGQTKPVPTQEELDAMKVGLPKHVSEIDVSKGRFGTTYKIDLFDENSNEAGFAYVSTGVDQPNILHVEATRLNDGYEGKGYGQALYREIAKLAQDIGASSLTSLRTSRRAANARSKILETKWEGEGSFADSNIPMGVRFMPEREEDPTKVAPGFYSKAGRVLLDKMPNRASAEQIRGILDPQKGSGVKPDEMKWSGINQFIDAMQAEKGYVTKDDVKQFLKDGYAAKFELKSIGQLISEWTLSDESTSETYYNEQEAKEAKQNWINGVYDNLLSDGTLDIEKKLDDNFVIIDQFGDRFSDESFESIEEAKKARNKFYREDAENSVKLRQERDGNVQYSKYKLPGGTNYEETVLRMPGVDYTSSHFDDVPNYVAHMRTQDFGNGRVIEELQSDLHKEARKEGYERLPDTTGWYTKPFPDDPKRLKVYDEDGVFITSPFISDPNKAIEYAATQRKDGVADAPFRKDWFIQLFKHALQKAVADGKEWIGWTGGEAQTDRYDLSKQVNRIVVGRNEDGFWFSAMDRPSEDEAEPLASKMGLTESQLADNIGKELASKAVKDITQAGGQNEYSGVDLKVGGEGMKDFYDTMLPKEIGKYVKQWGAKVEPSEVEGKKEYVIQGNPNIAPTMTFTNRSHAVVALNNRGRGEGGEVVEIGDNPKIWKVAITPEMSESVAGGQARFMPNVAVVPERFTGTAEEERRGKYVEPPKFFNKFNISQYEKGGKFFDAETGEDLTDKSYENASIAVINGKPSLVANNESETAGNGPLFKTNLFKQKAGWKWVSEGAPDTSTIVSVEGQGKHLYALQADFQNGVTMARYPDKASEPRLRPTGRGELTMGEQIGTIDIRGKQHLVYDKVTIGQAPESAQIRFMPEQLAVDEQTQQTRINEPGRRTEDIGVRPDETRNRGGQRTARGYSPLAGAPNVFGRSGPVEKISDIADRYAESRGIAVRKQAAYVKADVERGRRIAEEYANMPHDPQNPRVQEAYADLIRQSADQYKALTEDGYKAWFVDPANDPYEGKPWRAMRDLRENESMGVFPTEAGFGSGDTKLDVADNPLLGDSGLKWPYGSPDGPLRRVLWNDVFRYIHDAFGHGIEGAGFREDGEENAWQAHVRLFDGPAVGAMTSETRGQNSWLNFGPHAEKNKTASVEETIFADQKTGLMPEWTSNEGVAPDEPLLERGTLSGVPKPFEGAQMRFIPLSNEAQAELSLDEREQYNRLNPKKVIVAQMSKPDTEHDSLRVGTALLGTEANPVETPQTSNISGAIVPDKLLAAQLEKMDYPHLPDSILNEANPKMKRDKMVEFMKQNLKALYDAFPEEYRARATQWYDGARRLADELSAQHADITPEQAAGILAVFSPQKDWFMNVAQGYQCADVYKNEQNTVITPKLAKKEIEGIINAAQAPVKQKIKAPKGKTETERQKTIRKNKNKALDQAAKDKRRKVLEQLYDKKLSDLSDGTKEGDVLEAWGIRVLAQIKFGRRYKNIAPEGDLLGNARNKKGDKELTNTWGSTGEIRKAVSIMKDGNLKNISDKLGDEHKVRNFYNNIIAPNTPFGDATIDTHAVAAAHLMPYGSSADAVSDNFGGAGKSAPLGISGSYHIYMDAYQQLAKELGILPRQLQSITWEAIRELYPSEVRSPKAVKEAVQIWKQNNENDARQYILRNGVSAPVWARATNN